MQNVVYAHHIRHLDRQTLYTNNLFRCIPQRGHHYTTEVLLVWSFDAPALFSLCVSVCFIFLSLSGLPHCLSLYTDFGTEDVRMSCIFAALRRSAPEKNARQKKRHCGVKKRHCGAVLLRNNTLHGENRRFAPFTCSHRYELLWKVLQLHELLLQFQDRGKERAHILWLGHELLVVVCIQADAHAWGIQFDHDAWTESTVETTKEPPPWVCENLKHLGFTVVIIPIRLDYCFNILCSKVVQDVSAFKIWPLAESHLVCFPRERCVYCTGWLKWRFEYLTLVSSSLLLFPLQVSLSLSLSLSPSLPLSCFLFLSLFFSLSLSLSLSQTISLLLSLFLSLSLSLSLSFSLSLICSLSLSLFPSPSISHFSLSNSQSIPRFLCLSLSITHKRALSCSPSKTQAHTLSRTWGQGKSKSCEPTGRIFRRITLIYVPLQWDMRKWDSNKWGLRFIGVYESAEPLGVNLIVCNWAH